MITIKYRCPKAIVYRSPRYGKTKTIPEDYPSDGASGPATDIYSDSWWVHDGLCPWDGECPPEAVGFWERDGYWDDGTACGPVESSRVMRDILNAEGRHVRAFLWYWAVLPAQLWIQRHRDLTRTIAPIV